jgi:predicted HicB family RNase H-like nuclease
MKLHKLSQQDESGLKEVLVDLPDSLNVAAQIEAKRVDQSLEQWVVHAVAAALVENLNGKQAHG